MLCDKCGKEIADDSQFCGHCGATLSGAAASAGQAGQPPTPPGTQTYVPPPPPAGSPPAGPGQYGQPPKKSVLPWVLGGIALAAVVALVLVLVFVVFGGGESDTSGPEQTVERFWEALEKQDVDMLLSTMEPSYVSDLEEALGEDLEQFFEDYFFIAFPEDLEVTIRKMETEIDGDEALVTVVDGTMTYIDEYGDEVTEEASEGGMDAIPMVKVDGKWYLSGDALADLGLNPRSIKDLYNDEMDDTGTRNDGDNGGTSDEDYNEAEEMAEVEAAMIAYAEENSAAGLEFEIYNLFIKGDEAVGVAICTNQELEAPFIIMEKDSSGWYGVDFGTGWDPPVWYDAKMAEVVDAMVAFVKDNAAEGLEFEIYDLLIKGNEAVGLAVCINQEVDAPLVIMEKGSGGWYGVDVGTGIDAPYWYPWY